MVSGLSLVHSSLYSSIYSSLGIQQTCATFRPSAGSTIGTFTYTSSKGLCAIDATNGTLACSADITTGSEFTNVSNMSWHLGMIGCADDIR